MSTLNQPGPRETFRDHINVPIQIPAWGLLCMIIGAVFTSGTLYQKMDSLIESSQKNDAQIALIRDRQITNTSKLEYLESQGRAFEQRLMAIERASLK